MEEARARSRSPRSETYEEIVRLVVMRTQARLQKDWNLADTIRTKLTEMGVTLFDKTNSWHSKTGQTGRIPAFSELDAGQPIESIIQEQVMPQANGLSMSDVVLDDSQIRLLVEQLEQARAQKDFVRSDELRDELKTYGVEVFDNEKMWRAKNGLAGCIIGYAEGGATDLEITTLVVQREKARQSSDFGTADLIRNELRTAGVEIYDKEKVWKVGDGRQGPVPTWQWIQSGGDVSAHLQAQQQQQIMLSPDMAMAMGMVQVHGNDAMQAQVADQHIQDTEQAEQDQQAEQNHQFEQIQQLQQAQQLQVQQLQQLQQAQQAQQLQLIQQGQAAQALKSQKANEAAAIGTAMGQALQSMTVQAELQKQQQLQQAQLQQQQLQQLQLQQQLQSLTMAASPELLNEYQLQQLQTLTTTTTAPTTTTATTIPTITTTEATLTPELQKAMEIMQDCAASGRIPQDSEIDWLVGIREKLRQAKDFATADEIRNALRNNLGVELYEKEKRWATADGRQGFIPLWRDISSP